MRGIGFAFFRIANKCGGENLNKPQTDQELSKSQIYELQGIFFHVQPIFQQHGERTLGTALIHLMQSDVENLSTF